MPPLFKGLMSASNFDLDGNVALPGYGGWNTYNSQISYKVGKDLCGSIVSFLMCIWPGGIETKAASKAAGALYNSERFGTKSPFIGSKLLNGGRAPSGSMNSNNTLRLGWGQGSPRNTKILRIAVGVGQGTKRVASKIHFHITLLKYKPWL